jgi:subtilisin family serine protease
MLLRALAASLAAGAACVAAASGAGPDGPRFDGVTRDSERFDAPDVAQTDRVIVRLASHASMLDLALDLRRATVRLDAVLTPSPLRVLLRAPSPADGSRLAAALVASGRVAYAVPEVFQPMELRSRHVPNDPLFPEQWSLDDAGHGGGDVHAPEAWAYTLGSPAITIAVLDDGVQLDHPDLAPNIASNGRDFTVYPPAEGAQPRGADDRHGTSVAGIAAARGDNGLGVSGLCPRCKILPIRVHGSSNLGLAEAFRYAVEQGADVITNSWGYAPSARPRGGAAVDAAVRDAIDSAARDGRHGRGTLIVFGMTNEAVDNCGAHADISALDSVLAVGVSDRDDRIGGSGFGACMDLVAPAKPERLGVEGSATTDRTGLDGHVDGDYFTGFGGTSAAAPLVAGVAGLLLSLNPELPRDELVRILERTADKIDPQHAAYDGTGFSTRAGYGRLNAARAVEAVAADDHSR